MFSESKMAGPGYIILNILRVFNIITLILVVVASWVMLIRTVQTSNFFFFDGVSHFITQSIGLFLIVSELPLPFEMIKLYFARNWPLLSDEHGFVFLGSSMMVLGFNILGNLNKGATSIQELGLPLWRIVISSGILSAVLGLFNIIATYVFSDANLGITGRQVRSHGAAAHIDAPMKSFSLSSGSTRRAKSPVLPTYDAPPADRRSRFGRFGLPIRASGISKPIVQDPEQFAKFNERSSPVAPDIQRPATALHPAFQPGPTTDYPYPPPAPPASSRYSVVSNMTRF